MKIRGMVLNKKLIYPLLISGLLLSQLTNANDPEIKLKRSCIKANPLIEGETDSELLSIYQRICDKKNTEEKSDLLIQAANRFQQIDNYIKSMILIDYLQKQNVNTPMLTDVKFLLGVNLARSSLTKMRMNEARYLNNDLTYPAAKAFVELYRTSVPAEEMVKAKPDDFRIKPAVSPKPKVQREQPKKQTQKKQVKTKSEKKAEPVKPKTPFAGF